MQGRLFTSKKQILVLILLFWSVFAGQVLGMLLDARSAGEALSYARAASSGVLWAAGTAAAAWAGYRLLGRKAYQAPGEVCAAPERREVCRNALILLAAWTPCFLAYYPAIYSYDGEPQLIQYTLRRFDNHHPVAHTLFLGGCYSLGQRLKALGIPLDGMVFSSLVQMILTAFALSVLLRFIRRTLHVRRGVRAAVLLFFALFPVFPLMAVSTTKDTLFTAFFVFFTVRAGEILCGGPEPSGTGASAPGQSTGASEPGQSAGASSSGTGSDASAPRALYARAYAASVLMMLMRKNGVYMMAGLILVLAAAETVRAFRRFAGGTGATDAAKRERPAGSAAEDERPAAGPRRRSAGRALLMLSAAAVVSFVLIEGALTAAVGAVKGEAAEALSIPLQQIARTERSNGAHLTEEERREILYFITEEGLENYRPAISDVVKMNFDNAHFKAEPVRFLRLWVRLGKRFPGSYALAFLYHTMGAWYPEDLSHCTVYKDWWRDRTGYLITDAVPVFGGYDFVKKENYLPGIRDLYEAVATRMVYRRFFLTRALFSPWLYAAGTVFSALVLLLRRKYNYMLIMVPALLNVLMLLAGPCVIARYVYPFMALGPLFLLMAASPGKDGNGRAEYNVRTSGPGGAEHKESVPGRERHGESSNGELQR